jgi:hypothetical protein
MARLGDQLKPDDFPVQTEQKKIVKPDGKDIAKQALRRSPKRLRSS